MLDRPKVPWDIHMESHDWSSDDGVHNWTRGALIYNSSGAMDGSDRRGAIWAPMPVWDESTNRWNLFYVGLWSRTVAERAGWTCRHNNLRRTDHHEPPYMSLCRTAVATPRFDHPFRARTGALNTTTVHRPGYTCNPGQVDGAIYRLVSQTAGPGGVAGPYPRDDATIILDLEGAGGPSESAVHRLSMPRCLAHVA